MLVSRKAFAMNKLSHKSALPPIRLKLLAAFGSALLVLVVAWVGIAAINRQNEAQQRVYHAHEVRFRLRNIYDAVLEAQVGQSSYLLLGETKSLTALRTMRARVLSDLAVLLAFTSDPAQLARLNALLPILEGDISTLEESSRLIDTRDRAMVLAFVEKNKGASITLTSRMPSRRCAPPRER